MKIFKPVSFLLYLFCFMPFLYFLPIPSDTQPYAFIMACVLCLVLGKVKVPKTLFNMMWAYVLIVAGAVVTLLLAHPSEKFLVLRKVFNYISLFLVTTAVYNSLIISGGVNEKWEKILISIWFAVGAIQTYIYPSFMLRFVSNARTGGARGVVGLASEPSFYGYMMIFFLMAVSQFKRHKRIFQVMCIAQIILFAKSAVSLAYLAILIVCVVLKEGVQLYKKKPERIIAIGIFTIAFGFAASIFWNDFMDAFGSTRMVTIWQDLISNIGEIHSLQQLYQLDYSVATRVNAIVTSLREFLTYGGLPHGFVYEDFSFRVESGYGTLLYELGILGVLFIWMISKVLYKGFNRNVPMFVCISAMMFSSVQFGSPMLSFLLGYGMYNMHIQNTRGQTLPVQ
ncbi:hypothetical protein [Fournierella sp.]|uniref:hypothetical protein n=1 Tax=Allofournierella sp. TaxID=1940256 RepID=UPI0025BE2618|nr:hypothetical protein [Fournierella sp.]